MKKAFYITTIKQLFYFIIFFFCVITSGFSQCTGGTSGGALSPVPGASYQTMNLPAGDKYYTFVVAAGSCFPTYDFSYCSTDGSNAAFDTQITILDNSGVAVSGGYSDDFCGTQSHVTWTPTLAGTYRVHVNLYSCAATAVAATLAYKMTVPASMAYSSSNVVQASTATITKCDIDEQIVCLQVVTSGGCTSALSLTSIQLGAGSSSNLAADVSNIHVYYTGTTNTFGTTNEFVSGGTIPSGASNTIFGSQTLAAGTNYFWVAYDVNPASTTNNLLDASVTSFTLSGVARTPTATNPAGTRQITGACVTPTTGIDTWLKANVGVTGTSAVTAWANQNASGSTYTVSGTPSWSNTTSYNYNPYLNWAAPASTVTTTRQYLNLNNVSGLTGIDYKGFFYVCQLNDLTRTCTHLATVENVTNGVGTNGNLHGFDNGGVAGIEQSGYDPDFDDVSASVGTWQRNGSTVASNAVHLSTKHILSATSSGGTTTNRLLGGQRDNAGASFFGHLRDYKGYVSEIITYTAAVSSIQRQEMHTYLAIKYGTTLSRNYYNSSAAVVYSTLSPYNNNIIGIGRDDATSLYQKQSHNDDDSVRIYKGTLAATNPANASTFASNSSYVVIGANTGKLCNTTTSNAEKPAACALYSRLEREWKVTKTNFAESFNIDIRLNACAIPTIATFNVADLRLLVDDDGNFASGTTTCYYNGDGSGITISYANPVITVTGISNTHIANNVTKYITIGSVNKVTPLPIELLSFTAECNNQNSVLLKWTTATETNNDHFTLERSVDGANFEFITNVNGHGNSTQIQNYTYTDFTIANAQYYYRLKQTDYNGDFKYFNIIALDENCLELNDNGLSILNLYPNPVNEEFLQLEYSSDKVGKAILSFKNVLGQELYSQQIDLIDGKAKKIIAINGLSSGVYFVQLITADAHSKTLKLVRNK